MKRRKVGSMIYFVKYYIYEKKLSKTTFKLTENDILFHTLPNDKILDWFKLKAFADDKTNETEKVNFVVGRVENIVGKGENAGYRHFLLFPQCFQKSSFSWSFKVVIVW